MEEAQNHRAIIVCGPPASGKTTHGRKLAAERGAALLDIDTVTERLVKVALAAGGGDPDDRDSAQFKAALRSPIYETLFDIARENLPWTDVVIVGPFSRELRQPDWPAQLKQRLQAEVEIHLVHCPPEVRRKRMIARANPRDTAKLADWQAHLRHYDETLPPFPHVLIECL